MQNVMIALSGGVDSGVSAVLLREKGNNVRGLFMRHRYQKALDREETRSFLAARIDKINLTIYSVDSDGNLNKCDWNLDYFPFLLPHDAAAAIDLAIFLGLELILLDVDLHFSAIIDDFVREYYCAKTPNPCVLCNKKIKFGLLWRVAKKLGADVMATGHYVRIRRVQEWLDSICLGDNEIGKYFRYDTQKDYSNVPEWLCRDGLEYCFTRSLSEKDQTYFLYGIDSNILPNLDFPIGEYTKSEVRRIATEKGLPVANRKDSQEVCFVPDNRRIEFIRNYCLADSRLHDLLPTDSSGSFLSLDGRIIGRHLGYEKYTIGQRKGLGMGFGQRIFVQSINPESHDVVLGPYDSLGVRKVKAVDSNWHVDVPISQEFRCEVKVRYRNESSLATVKVSPDGSLEATLDLTRYGVAPGQALVCYWRDRLLGGGRIVL